AGNVYVVDGNQRGQKFNSIGTFLFKFSGPGSSTPGKLIAPAGVAVDSAGNIYVTDSDPDRTNDLVQKFDSSGAFVSLGVREAPATGSSLAPPALRWTRPAMCMSRTLRTIEYRSSRRPEHSSLIGVATVLETDSSADRRE